MNTDKEIGEMVKDLHKIRAHVHKLKDRELARKSIDAVDQLITVLALAEYNEVEMPDDVSQG